MATGEFGSDNGFKKSQITGIIDNAAKIISSGIFVGYIPFASGTFGSLWILALYFLIPDSLFKLVMMFLVPFLYLLGVWTSSRCVEFWGKDPSKVIIDEVVGMFITLMFMPLNAKIVWLGFLIFRAFDIIKPPPTRLSESLPGGWGIMTDDVIAGVYANLVLRILIFSIPQLV